jgi:hypothetical protein
MTAQRMVRTVAGPEGVPRVAVAAGDHPGAA